MKQRQKEFLDQQGIETIIETQSASTYSVYVRRSSSINRGLKPNSGRALFKRLYILVRRSSSINRGLKQRKVGNLGRGLRKEGQKEFLDQQGIETRAPGASG